MDYGKEKYTSARNANEKVNITSKLDTKKKRLMFLLDFHLHEMEQNQTC